MHLNLPLREMIGDELADAVDAARDALANGTVMARCSEGMWAIDVDNVVVASDLTLPQAVAHLEGMA